MSGFAYASAGGNGKSADHANEHAGANEHAASNPHAETAAASEDSSSSSSSSTASTETSAAAAASTSTASAASTSSGDSSKANRGCNQTPYGATGPGANHSGPYDDTCDGSPSGNGNGNGKATGKPCAGCVGKADEKNPHGQYPGGSDHNKGYECDGNHGIGRTNPAHTGCKTPPPGPCVPTQEHPCNPCVPTETNPCTNPGCVPTTTNPCDTDTEVEGETLTRTTPKTSNTPGTNVLGEVFERPAGSLAFTGTEVKGTALAGTALILFGSAMVLATRRRRPEAIKAH